MTLQIMNHPFTCFFQILGFLRKTNCFCAKIIYLIVMRCGVANFGQRPEGSINAPNLKFLVPNFVLFYFFTQQDDLSLLYWDFFIYISNFQGTQKYSAVMFYQLPHLITIKNMRFAQMLPVLITHRL